MDLLKRDQYSLPARRCLEHGIFDMLFAEADRHRGIRRPVNLDLRLTAYPQNGSLLNYTLVPTSDGFLASMSERDLPRPVDGRPAIVLQHVGSHATRRTRDHGYGR